MQQIRPFLANWWFGIGLIILFSGLYLVNIDGWLMHDDEGTDFYEVWQLQEGQQPGVDYLEENFVLNTVFDRAGQQIEVFERK